MTFKQYNIISKTFHCISSWFKKDPKEEKYKYLYIMISFLLIFLAYLAHYVSKFFAQFLLSAAGGFLIAGILQVISRDTLIKRMSEDISAAVVNIAERMLPNRIYRPTDKELIQETKEYLERVGLFRFMSISGVNLLTKRLPASVKNIHRRVTVKLLLLDPIENSILETRVNQMCIGGELKSVDKLKEEIILCIISIFCLRKKYRALNFQIRFHKEYPTARCEFFGDENLYLQYYRSQRSSSDLGPILKYGWDRDVFIAFEDYFTEVWIKCERNERKIIIDDDITNGSEIKEKLVGAFGNDIVIPIDIENKDLSAIWNEVQEYIVTTSAAK
jgi:hypothetical protein